MTFDTLQGRLVALVNSEVTPEALDRFQSALAAGATTYEPSTELPGYLLMPLLRAWEAVGHEAMPPGALALALGAARRVRADAAAASPRLDLVWTGPHSPANVQALTTTAVLREMIEGARHKILVVGYNLTRHNEFSVGVIDALAKAAGNGRRVIMALHDDGSNFGYLTDLWPRNLPLPRLLRWVGVPEDPKASLHAKLVVADASDLLVTSANLTFHGLEQNIEMGVRIRGSFAFEVDRHFSNLEREGVLVPFQGAWRT